MKILISWLIWLLLIGIAVLLIIPQIVISSPLIAPKYDDRIALLGQFFNKHHFAPLKAKDFLACSDKYSLDWRVLPVIALKESSGGIHYWPRETNNIMGMIYSDNGQDFLKTYGSIQESICASAALLDHLSPQTLEGKIKRYNSVNPDYWPDTLRLMNEIK